MNKYFGPIKADIDHDKRSVRIAYIARRLALGKLERERCMVWALDWIKANLAGYKIDASGVAR